MRSVLSRQSRQFLKACEGTSTRSFVSSARKASTICQICNKPQRPATTCSAKVNRRCASTSASGDAIKPSAAVPKTHYEFFPKTLSDGPPPRGKFVIDLKQLRNEFLQLQAVAHPDRHPSSLKARAEATSARINEAYKTLQNPLLRAQYLLSLRGLDVSEDETAKIDDPDFLMEVMEIHETLDNSQDEAEIESLKSSNETKITECEQKLDIAFSEENFEVAREEAVRLKYWVKIKHSIDEWEEQRIMGEK